MLLLDLFKNPVMVVIYILAIGLAIGVHEAAHAWTASAFGDDTAKNLGRTSINPLVHIDPIGTLLFLIAGFGWGKPVPVDERNLRNRNQVILVALAGPASNLLLAIVLAIFYRFIPVESLQAVLTVFIIINLSLMLFNLIPIPPLDGSKILRLFIPARFYWNLEQYGFLILLGIFLLFRTSNGPANWLGIAIGGIFQFLTGVSHF